MPKCFQTFQGTANPVYKAFKKIAKVINSSSNKLTHYTDSHSTMSRERKTETKRQRDRDRETQREAERETDRQTETETETV